MRVRILRNGARPGDLTVVRGVEFVYLVDTDIAGRSTRFPPIEFMQIAETVNRPDE